MSEDEKVTLGNEKVNQMGSFTFSKDGWRSEDAKCRIVKARGVFSQLKKFGRIGR